MIIDHHLLDKQTAQVEIGGANEMYRKVGIERRGRLF